MNPIGRSQTTVQAGHRCGDEVMAAIRADPFARHEIPAWTDPVARGLIEQCWEADGRARPPFEHVRDVLTGWFCGAEVGGDRDDVYAAYDAS